MSEDARRSISTATIASGYCKHGHTTATRMHILVEGEGYGAKSLIDGRKCTRVLLQKLLATKSYRLIKRQQTADFQEVAQPPVGGGRGYARSLRSRKLPILCSTCSLAGKMPGILKNPCI